jgi:benzoyl-CoA reductase/2-hydroxyglutaryl-CoA dehydratase subunit BcrC/BadD/HgdB
MLQTDAIFALENYYSRDAIWEDEGYYCGGEYTNIKLLSKENETYLVEGNVTYAQNYCQYTSIASFVVELYSEEGKVRVNEIEFDENNK